MTPIRPSPPAQSVPGAVAGAPGAARAAAPGRRRVRHRRFAWALIGYGCVGLLLAGLSLILVIRTLPVLDAIDRQRIEIIRWLDITSKGIDDIRLGAAHAGTSIDSAASSARNAAALSDDLAGTMASLRDASGLEVLGSRPFSSLTDDFDRVAGRAHALASSMSNLAGSLDGDTTDFAAVAADAGALGGQVTALRDVVAGDGSTGLGGSVGRLFAVVVILVLWLAVPAAASLVVGVIWLRELGRPRPSGAA
jgi:hypothetical protein